MAREDPAISEAALPSVPAARGRNSSWAGGTTSVLAPPTTDGDDRRGAASGPENPMRIHVCIRATLDWQDRAAVEAGLISAFRPKYDAWNATSDMPYHRFRHRVCEIAQLALSRVEGVLSSTPDAVPPGDVLVPVDDDDWLAPDLASHLGRANARGTRGYLWSRAVIEPPEERVACAPHRRARARASGPDHLQDEQLRGRERAGALAARPPPRRGEPVLLALRPPSAGSPQRSPSRIGRSPPGQRSRGRDRPSRRRSYSRVSGATGGCTRPGGSDPSSSGPSPTSGRWPRS